MKRLDNQITVTSQLTPVHLQQAKELGFQSIICNRPDNEEMGQPNFQVLADEAGKLGLSIHHLPVNSPAVADHEIQAFKNCLDTTPKPILAFCKTGTRAATLWAKSQQGHLDDETIKQCCQAAGYQINLESTHE